MQIGVTGALDGTEIGYTELTMQTTGTLTDAPQVTERREWWQGKLKGLALGGEDVVKKNN